MSGPSLEIERKFLVEALPELTESAGRRIEQGYLAADDGGAEVRLRKKGDHCFLTVKQGTGLSRLEAETALTREQYDALWPLTEGRRLRKVRYELPLRDLTIELDVYRGALEGLVVAEVEFPDIAASVEFTPPDWFGEDVTSDDRYKNRNLAVGGAG